jgi:hypothetical protein
VRQGELLQIAGVLVSALLANEVVLLARARNGFEYGDGWAVMLLIVLADAITVVLFTADTYTIERGAVATRLTNPQIIVSWVFVVVSSILGVITNVVRSRRAHFGGHS